MWEDNGVWCCECPSCNQTDGYFDPGARQRRLEIVAWVKENRDGLIGYGQYLKPEDAPLPDIPTGLIFVRFHTEGAALHYKLRWWS